MRTLVPLLLLLLALPAQARPADVQVLMAGESEDDLVGVLELAKGAKHRLWVFAYSLTDAGLIQVLTEKAATPGFDLHILVDKAQYQKDWRLLEPLKDELTPVVPPDGGRQHIKLMLIDDHTFVAGSKNWSHFGNQAKWNDVVVVRDMKLAAQVKQAFESVGQFRANALEATEISEDPAAEPANVTLQFNAPGRQGVQTRDRLIAMIQKARKRIHLGMFIFSDPRLAKAVWLQSRRGRVEIRVVLDAVQHENLKLRKDAAGKILLGYFRDLGERVRLARGHQLHHKLAVIDDVVITGSANWSKAAWLKNHEVVLFLRAPKGSKGTPRFLETYRERLDRRWEAAAE